MKGKWALCLCEGLMTQAALSLPEMILFFFFAFSWLLSNHHREQGEGRQREEE